MKRGDLIEVITGILAGQRGRVICAFRGWLTVLRQDSTAFDCAASDCRVIPAGGTNDTN
jgi:hypothetical protein